MRNILAIIERELRGYFSSPIAYVILTGFLLLSGIVFQSLVADVMDYQLRSTMQAAQMGPRPIDAPAIISSQYLSTVSVLLLFMVPMITMGLFSEEKKRGTIELLLTAPITDLQVVLGKFLAAVSFFVIMLASTWIPLAVLYIYASAVASGPILTIYLGIFLYGLAIVSIGVFVSTLTENQIISGILGFVIALALWFLDVLSRRAEGTTKAVLEYLSVINHLNDFMRGVLATSHIIFYLSLMLVALFLTYRSIDSLRWRG